MGLSQVVASVAVVPAAICCTFGTSLPIPVFLCLLQVTGVGITVAVAASDWQAENTQGILGKEKNGKISLWGGLLFWPYHLGLRIRLHIRKLKTKEPLYHEIISGWYVGGWPMNGKCLPPGDPSIVDCTCEFPKTHNSSRYLCLLVWDSHGATAEQLKEAVDWACNENNKGHPIYIHCAHGHGRSVAVLIACFLKKRIYRTIEEAEAMIKRVRPKIRLNRRQKTKLREWMKLEHQLETAVVN
eukprot:g2582.t1